MRTWPVAITATGNAAAATVAWRRGARLFVTVVVKGTFALVPNEPMVPLAPEPVHAEEQPSWPGGPLRAADDLAPYRAQTDVCLTGYAVARAPEARSVAVRLALVRDEVALLDKRRSVAVPPADRAAAAGDQRRVALEDMGPLPRRGSVRGALLGRIDPRSLEGPVLQIVEPFDWRYFQVSPADQRVGPLRGDEWLLLEGVHPTLDRLAARLPSCHGAARVGRAGAGGAQALALVLDGLFIDSERRRCSMTWRGHFPVAAGDDLASLQVVAGIGGPAPRAAAPAPVQAVQVPAPVQAAQMPAPVQAAQAPAPVQAAQMRAPVQAPAPVQAAQMRAPVQAPAPVQVPGPAARERDPLAGTLRLEDDDLIPVEEADPLAGTMAMEEGAGGDPLAGTLGLTEETAAELAARAATPFERVSAPPSMPQDSRIAQQVSQPADDPLAGTLGLLEETAAEIAARPATPFRPGQASAFVVTPTPAHAKPGRPAESDPLAGTLGLLEETAAEIAARAATPFEGPARATPAAPPMPPAPPPVPAFSGAMPAVPPEPPAVPVSPPPAPEVLAPPVLPATMPEAPKSLGDHFLLAMAASLKQRTARS